MGRMFLSLFLLAVAAIPLSGQSQGGLQAPPKKHYKYDGKIVTTYDKVKNETLVFSQLMRVKDVEDPHRISEDNAQTPRDWSRLDFTVFFSYPGQSVITPKEVSIGFLYDAHEPKFYEGHVLKARIDGERVVFGQMEVLKTTTINRGSAYYTMRRLELVVPYEQLLRLANAKKVSMTLGSVEFDLSKDHLEAIRDLASRTTP